MLIRWAVARYHYSVEYFEDLRNVNHCEFIIMDRSEQTGKYVLQNQLRTWSAYKREEEEKRAAEGVVTTTASVKDINGIAYCTEDHQVPRPRRWGGCVNGCNHAKYKWYTYQEPHADKGTGEHHGTQNLVQSVEERLRERLGVLEAGRDFGGSRSGAGSDVEDSGSGSGGEEDDVLELVKQKMMMGKRPVEIVVQEVEGEVKVGNGQVRGGEESPFFPSPPQQQLVVAGKAVEVRVNGVKRELEGKL